MKMKIRTSCFTIAMALILVTTAFSQNARVSADIPFDFYIGEAKMASGNYTVEMLGGPALLIRSVRGYAAVATLSRAASEPQDLHGRMLFTKYGAQYFLSEISWLGGPARALPKTAGEIETAKRVGPGSRFELATR